VIPGHGTDRVSTLRLWKAAAPSEIDLGAFNTGDYQRAAEFKNRFENISWVLYPNDSTAAGRELRLRQEYFFVAASMQDILERHMAEHGTFNNLAEHVAIHLNDTHPAIGVAELMRLLVDEQGMTWDAAWDQCRRIFSYTNHTLMPEALETWKVTLIQRVLPRHILIIYRINQEFLDEVIRLYPGDVDLMRRVSLIDDGGGHDKDKRVRMANLCIVGSHRVNGVSQLHSDLMVQTIFADFARLYPERFHNKTNGVTPRRWLAQANPALSTLLDERLGGKDWRLNLDRLQDLRASADDVAFRAAFAAAKRGNKVRLANYVAREVGVTLDPDSLFDVQVKRIHEYKRQLLNVLHVITRYNALLDGSAEGLCAAQRDLRRQGGVVVSHGQTGDPPDPRCRGGGQQRPADARPAAGRLHSQLRRFRRRVDHAGGQSLGADFDGRHRSLGHRQHETLAQRRIDHRHRGWRQHRDSRQRRRREHFHLRQQHGPGQRHPAGRSSTTGPVPGDPALKEALDRIDSGFFSPGERRATTTSSTACCTTAITICCSPTTPITWPPRRVSMRFT
jgi:hypothetical protein